MDNNSVKISLVVDSGLTGEEKVTYAELLHNSAMKTLESISLVGINGEIKAAEAFMTGISYEENTVSILLNPKNRFFHNELNKTKDIVELAKIAGVNFGLFSKIAVIGITTFSSELEDQMITRCRTAATKNLIEKNTKLIVGSIENSIFDELDKRNPVTAKNKMRM